MRGPTAEARVDARRRFEAGESLLGISKATGIDRKTLRSMKERESWIPHVIPQVGNDDVQRMKAEARKNVIDFATRKAVEQIAESGVIDQQADDIAESLQGHGRISKLMLRYAEKMMDDAIAGKIYPGEKQSAADVFNSVVTGVAKAVASSREIAGLKAGQISATQSSTNDVGIVIEQRRLETVKLPVNERGRLVSDVA